MANKYCIYCGNKLGEGFLFCVKCGNKVFDLDAFVSENAIPKVEPEEEPFVEETPVVEEPVVDETPVEEIPEEPIDDEPVVEETPEEPEVIEPVEPEVEEPSIDEPEEPAVEEPIIEEHEEPVVEEPIVDQQVNNQQQVIEETPVEEEPVVEEVRETPVYESVEEREARILEMQRPIRREEPVVEEETPVAEETPVEEETPIIARTRKDKKILGVILIILGFIFYVLFLNFNYEMQKSPIYFIPGVASVVCALTCIIYSIIKLVKNKRSYDKACYSTFIILSILIMLIDAGSLAYS